MSATTQIKTFSDAYTDLQNRVRVQTGITATENQAKRYINIALQDMHVGYAERFPWAERQGLLLTHPQYNTGTVAISQGSASLVGTGTAWDTNNAWTLKNARAGGRILLEGSQEVYTVQSVGGDTAITLTGKWTGEDLTAGTYLYFEDEYDLASDFLRPLDQQQFSDGISIDLLGRKEFRRRYPRNSVVGKPFVGCIIDRAPTGNVNLRRGIRLHRPPQDAMQIPYSYITANLVTSSAGTAQTEFSADTDEPIIPIRFRHILVFHALYHWYRDKKDDTRSQEAKGEYTDLMLRVSSDNEIGTDRASIKINSAKYRRRAASPYRGGSRRYDTNNKFDRMEE